MLHELYLTAMKKVIVLVLLSWQTLLFGQTTLTESITHDDEQRSYVIYVPASYTAEQEVPLVLNFHGYGSSAVQQMNYGDFRAVADTAGFILVHPQGAVFEGFTHWNVGSWVNGSPYDDVSFTAAILDKVESEYSIDSKRIYSTGMSNGGYMSFLLACQLSDRIAAIASVTGSMTPNNLLSCGAQRPMPIMQIHGTNDGTVPYVGALWTEPVAAVVDYWVDHNACDQEPITLDLPDLNANDGSTATFFRYDNGEEGAVVEHIRINGGNHTWPGASFVTPGTNLDFSASEAIWQFFSRYSLDGLVTTVTDTERSVSQLDIVVNNTLQQIVVQGQLPAGAQYHIYTTLGQSIKSGSLTAGAPIVDISSLSFGAYIILVNEYSQLFYVVK